MQDADGIAEVQALSQPSRRRRPRVQAEAFFLVPGADHRHWVATQIWTTRDIGENVAIRAAETKLAIRLALDLKALFMDGAMVATAEQRKIRQRGGPAVGPVLDVMALAETSPTAGEAAATVPVMECSPDRRRNRAGPRADLQQSPIGVVAHHDPARVAR